MNTYSAFVYIDGVSEYFLVRAYSAEDAFTVAEESAREFFPDSEVEVSVIQIKESRRARAASELV